MAQVNVQEYVINFKEVGIKQILSSLESINSAAKELNKISGNIIDYNSISTSINKIQNLYRDIFKEEDSTIATNKIKATFQEVIDIMSSNNIQFISEEEKDKTLDRIEQIKQSIKELQPEGKREMFNQAWSNVMKTNQTSYNKAVAKLGSDMPAVGSIDSVNKIVNDKSLISDSKTLHNILQKVVTEYNRINEQRQNLLKTNKEDLETEQAKLAIYNKTAKTGVTQEQVNAIQSSLETGKSNENLPQTTSFIDDEAKAMNRLSAEADMLTKRFFGWQAVIGTLKKVLKELYQVTKQLDDAFNGIAVVTSYTTKEVWNMYDAFLGIANAVGMSSTEVTKIAQEYFKQGKSYQETLKLTEAAAISAKIAGIEASESIDYLTSALNGYNLSANEALTVSDKFAKLASSSASDYEELATAMSKVAAQANASGVSMDSLMGFMTKALETTREAPENIGTAFKTIFARMSEIKDYGKVLEDNTSANKVSKALDSIGIALFDATGNMRDLDDVLIEVGYKWKDLNSVQQKYIATALAGTRQQTRLISIFQDFDRTMELIAISEDSAGASLAQHAKTMESLDYSITELQNAWEAFVRSLASADIFKFFIDQLTIITNIINKLSGPLWTIIGLVYGLSLAVGTLSEVLGQIKLKEALWITPLKGLQNIIKLIGIDIDSLGIAVLEFSDAMKKTTGSIAEAKKAFMGAFNPTALGITALVITIVAVINAIKSYRDRITELYSEIYDIKDTNNNLESLIKQYETLKEKVQKTNEELQEMKDLQQQIQEASSNEINFTSNGQIVGYDKYQLDQAKEAIEDYKELYNNSYSTNYRSDNTEEEKAAIVIAEVMRLASSAYGDAQKSAEDYYNLVTDKSAEAQDQLVAYTEIAKKRLEDMPNLSDAFKEVKTTDIAIEGTTETIVDAGAMRAQFNQVAQEAAKLASEGTSFIDFKNFINSDLFNGLTEAAQNSMLEAIASFNEDGALILSLSQKMNTTFEEALNKTSEWIDSSGLTTNIMQTISDSMSDIVDPNIDQNKFNNALTKVFDSAQDGTVGLKNYYNALKECGVASEDAVLGTVKLYESLVNVAQLDVDLSSIRNAASDFDSLNESLQNNTTTFDNLIGLFSLYPQYLGQMTSDIQQFGAIQQDTIAKVQEAERAEYLENLEITKNKLIAAQELVKQELEQYQTLYELALQGEWERLKVEYDAWVEQAQSRIQLEIETQKVIEEIRAGNTSATLSESIHQNIWSKENQDRVKANLKATVDEYQQQYDNLSAQIAALDVLKNQGIQNANNFFTGTKDSSSSSSSASEYERKLDSTYEAVQRLNAATKKLEAIDTLKDLFKERNGNVYRQLLDEQTQAIKDQSTAYESLIDAQESAQSILMGKYSAAVRSVFKLENGKLIPIMEKYNSLSSENAKLADELAEKYNELSDNITDNTIALVKNEQALKEIENEKRDMVIETQEILIEAIRSEQKARVEAAQEALDKEKELLEERKKIYKEAFNTEDYNNELADLETRRNKIIEQLASLEGATDSNSKQRRADLLEELEELNKDYNTKVTDYNRDALLKQIDEEIEEKDKESETLQKQYEERINDYAWLQEQIALLTSQGVDACLGYLKNWHDDYISGTIEMKEKTEEEWKNIFDAVYGSSTDSKDILVKRLGEMLTTQSSVTSQMVDNWNAVYEAAKRAASVGGSGGTTTTTTTTTTKTTTDFSYSTQARDKSMSNKEKLWEKSIKGYASGGYNTETGLAMLHGTRTKPETVLNPQDTANFNELKNTLRTIADNGSLNGLSGVTIDNITIKTDSMNSNQDFINAGKMLGNGLQDILRQRGLISNLKR